MIHKNGNILTWSDAMWLMLSNVYFWFVWPVDYVFFSSSFFPIFFLFSLHLPSLCALVVLTTKSVPTHAQETGKIKSEFIQSGLIWCATATWKRLPHFTKAIRRVSSFFLLVYSAKTTPRDPYRHVSFVQQKMIYIILISLYYMGWVLARRCNTNTKCCIHWADC